MKAEIYALRDLGGDFPEEVLMGTITYENGVISGDTLTANNIIDSPIPQKDGSFVTAQNDPARFMQLLPMEWGSSRMGVDLIRD